jgi:prepilin-type N-terminal cleavage/methylation domain-containing protein
MQKLFTRNDESGFTLVEVVVVIGILAILLAIATPLYLNQRKEAWKAAVRDDIAKSVLVVERDKNLNGSYQPYASAPPNVKVSPDVSLKVSVLPAVSGNTACIEAFSTRSPSDTLFHYNIAKRKLLSGGC